MEYSFDPEEVFLYDTCFKQGEIWTYKGCMNRSEVAGWPACSHFREVVFNPIDKYMVLDGQYIELID